jgi:hypothetical protein
MPKIGATLYVAWLQYGPGHGMSGAVVWLSVDGGGPSLSHVYDGVS